MFDKLGYEVIDVSPIANILMKMREHSLAVFNCFSEFYYKKPVNTDEELVLFRQMSQKEQYQALKQLQFSPQIFRVAGDSFFPEVLKSKFGYKMPNLDLPPYMRCDIPINEQSLFRQHQDYSYNTGSSNSVTIWIPLQDTSISEGALLCSPGSHNNGVYENCNGIIHDRYEFDFEPVPVKFGQALLFDQKLVHKSGFNVSRNVRFSIILRFSDLGDLDYLKRGCPLNHEISTIKYAEATR